jgi:hypothetical protein
MLPKPTLLLSLKASVEALTVEATTLARPPLVLMDGEMLAAAALVVETLEDSVTVQATMMVE